MNYKNTQFGKLPEHWEVSNIKKVAQKVTDYVSNGSFAALAENVKYKDKVNFAVLIRLVDYNNNFNGRFIYIDEHAYEFLKKSKLFGGEIIISNVGANVGTVFKCPYLDTHMSLGPNAIMVKFDGCNDFYFYWLKSPGGQYMLHSIITGSAQPKFNKTNFKDMMVPVPPIDEQRKIAGILSLIDTKIENNQRINQNLEQQAQALFKSWFLDFDPFGGIAPDDWIAVTLGKVASIRTETFSPAKNPDVIVEHYSIPAYDEKHYPVFEPAAGIKSNKYILTPMSVMISKLNPETKRIWRPLCVSDMAISSTEFIVYEACNPSYKDFIYSVIDSTPFFQYLCAHTTGSTNSRQRATPKATLDFPLLLPTKTVVIEFCSLVSPMYDLIAENIMENQSLAHIRDDILPKLMTGELDVSAIDI